MNYSFIPNRKKRIIISTGSMQAGGTERVISNLSNTLISDYDITIVIWRSLPAFYPLESGIKLIDLQKETNSTSLLSSIKKFHYILKECRPDLVLGFSAPFNIISIIGAIGCQVKMVVCERNDPRFVPFKRIQRIFRNLLYIYPAGVLAQTAHNKDYFPFFIKNKTTIICNPVYISDEKVGFAQKFEKKKKIVSVARLKQQKNQAMLIKAFKSFKKTHLDYQLYIYGEGDQRTELELLVNKLGLKECVLLPGVQHNILECIADADFFVLPSNFEGMPNALLEAMCIGLPCISTRVSGAVDFIEHMKNGIIVDVNNEEELLKYMLLLAEDTLLKTRISNNASKIYEKVNLNSVIKEWNTYIEGMMPTN